MLPVDDEPALAGAWMCTNISTHRQGEGVFLLVHPTSSTGIEHDSQANCAVRLAIVLQALDKGITTAKTSGTTASKENHGHGHSHHRHRPLHPA